MAITRPALPSVRRSIPVPSSLLPAAMDRTREFAGRVATVSSGSTISSFCGLEKDSLPTSKAFGDLQLYYISGQNVSCAKARCSSAVSVRVSVAAAGRAPQGRCLL